MKKVLSLVMILILSLTSCGGKGGGASDDPNLGKYIGEEYSGDGSNWFSLSEIFDEGESYIELKDGGKGVFCLGGDATDIKWTLESDGTLKLTRDSLESNGTLKDGMITLTDLWGNEVTITFRKEGGSEAAATGDALLDWWNGDWYGWWIIESGTGDYTLSEGGWWDACAHIDLGEDGSGTLTLWDDSCEAGEYIAQASVQAEADLTTSGRLVSTDGSFLNCPLTGADAWYIDAAAPESMPYHDMICISGVYTDPEGSGSSFVYTIYLRPWGMDWEDVRAKDESLLPYYYDDWYLPLIEAGGSMPDQIGEALSYA